MFYSILLTPAKEADIIFQHFFKNYTVKNEAITKNNEIKQIAIIGKKGAVILL